MEGDFLTVLFRDSEEKVPGVAVPLGSLNRDWPAGCLRSWSGDRANETRVRP